MTTRFSLAELADMLHVPVSAVRRAVEALAAEGALTAETFSYLDRNWRVAPSDVKRVQDWLEAARARGELDVAEVRHKVKRRQVVREASPPGE
ncbi:MAG: hypothetical protein K6T30_08440 [Alicyclobacillus sp.]|nr:hypothetical protein [Alicyclobacillus sp.]